jgi:UDP-GlcNAc:undecaprenyl-phosphate/decaprenyl-phosphate GlcNAc-1-phosphate transferase
MTHANLLTVAVFITATILSTILVPVACRLALRLGAVDAPGARKIHQAPMPRLGGVAIYAAFIGVVVAGYYLGQHLLKSTQQDSVLALLQPVAEGYRVRGKFLAVVGGATAAFLVGLFDDLMGGKFPPGPKAVGQLLAAMFLVVGDVRTAFLPFDALNILVTLLWVVGITNAFNLLDNMDGLSAGVAFIAAVILFVNAWAQGEMLVGLIFAAFIGSLLGFLFFNTYPAKVFLGDCGSLFIGYMMAALTLLERYTSHASSTLFPVLMPVLVLAIPLIDTTTVVIIRLRERRPIYIGDARHLSHRLLSLGFSQRTAVLFIYLATACFGLGAVVLPHASEVRSWLIMLQSCGFMALLLILMFFDRRQKPRDRTS